MAIIWPSSGWALKPTKILKNVPYLFTLNPGESDESFSRCLWFVESASVVNLASLEVELGTEVDWT